VVSALSCATQGGSASSSVASRSRCRSCMGTRHPKRCRRVATASNGVASAAQASRHASCGSVHTYSCSPQSKCRPGCPQHLGRQTADEPLPPAQPTGAHPRERRQSLVPGLHAVLWLPLADAAEPELLETSETVHGPTEPSGVITKADVPAQIAAQVRPQNR
jgi:hypothetical protein